MNKPEILLLLLLLLECYCYDNELKECHVHTWNNITSFNGNWKGRITPIYENSYYYYSNCTNFNNFEINEDNNQSLLYGFKFDKDATFNLAYSITMVKEERNKMIRYNNTKNPEMSSPSCIYIVTAKSPANPDINVLSYMGGNCGYVNIETGTIFYVM